ncbi:MAG: rod shape-determining protein MreC [Terriglobia bacterium]
MLEIISHESPPAERPPERETPERVRAFVSGHRAFFTLIAVLIAQLLLLSVQITRNQKVRLIQVWAVSAVDPFARVLRGTVNATTGAWGSYRDLWKSQQQNRELSEQLTAARTQIQQLSQQADEARRLRDLLEFKNHLPFQAVAAEVIASSPGEASRAIFIDKGSDAGLTPDLAVVTPSGVVGKIIAVFPHTAQVMLVTDTSSGVACALDKSRVQGILKGASLNLCQIQYVMNEAPVSAGEMVLTSGLDQIYPKGLPIGSVSEVAEGNIYKTIKVKPAAALDRLETVLVVVKSPSGELQANNTPARH